jgi:hypothetical protein
MSNKTFDVINFTELIPLRAFLFFAFPEILLHSCCYLVGHKVKDIGYWRAPDDKTSRTLVPDCYKQASFQEPSSRGKVINYYYTVDGFKKFRN